MNQPPGDYNLDLTTARKFKSKSTSSIKIQGNDSNYYLRLKYHLSPRARLYTIAILFAWLLMNSDPLYQRRVLATMSAASILDRSIRSLFQPLRFRGSSSNNGGMSTVEAIALIQAINSNRNSNLSPELTALMLRQPTPELSNLFSSLTTDRQSSLTPPSQQIVSDRQLPVPLPVPIPVAVVLAAVAAFAAAAAAGFAPLVAVAAAALAALAAILVALIIVVGLIKGKGKGKGGGKGKGKGKGAFIKKLVIKKTVLPFVIPIPIPIKKKEKEIIYMHKPEHHHYEHKEKGKGHSYEIAYKQDVADDAEIERKSKPTKSTPPKDNDSLDRLQILINEQTKIQKALENVALKMNTSST